jgi:coenzyme Q-binding protein COQ10
MLQCQRSLSLPYAPRQIFDLVADVSAYPSFLPWCIQADVLESTPDNMVADLSVGKGLFQGRFRSYVKLFPPHEIHVTALHGPLKSLSNGWVFHPLSLPRAPVACRVALDLSFAFQNPLFDQLMGGFFDTAIPRLLGAFEARAHALYGLSSLMMDKRREP